MLVDDARTCLIDSMKTYISEVESESVYDMEQEAKAARQILNDTLRLLTFLTLPRRPL